MGNVYRYTECEICDRAVEVNNTFIIHGGSGLTELARLRKIGEDPTVSRSEMPVGKIAAHFCGHCGGFVPLEDRTCACESFSYQGWNYQVGDTRKWEEPESWED